MGPWTVSKPEKIPFAEIGNKGKVHDLIRLAQHVILNPNSDPVQFQYGGMPNLDDLSKNMEAKFSPNTICLDISGPVETALKSKRFLVEVVTNWMIKHIKSQSCIIILIQFQYGGIPNLDNPPNWGTTVNGGSTSTVYTLSKPASITFAGTRFALIHESQAVRYLQQYQF